MLYGESASLTPDTNGPPSFPCMKNQLMNVTRVYKKTKNKKIADTSSHTWRMSFFQDFVHRVQRDILKADYDDT